MERLLLYLCIILISYCNGLLLTDVHISLSNNYNEMLLTFSHQKIFQNVYVTYYNSDHIVMNVSVIMKPYQDDINIYASVLSNLEASTKYEYNIMIDHELSFNSTFFSAPKTATDVYNDKSIYRIILFGDQGTTISPSECASHNDCGAKYNNDFIAQSINEPGQPNFVAVVGDLAYDRGNETLWQIYFDQISSWAASIPIITCVGNEDHAQNFSQYRHRLFLPGQDISQPLAPFFYSFDYDYVHIISMSTEYSHNGGASFYPGSQQYKWLENDLEQASRSSKTRWILVIGHRPLYCSSNDYYDCNIWDKEARPVLEPLYSKYNVDAVFSGHVHSYERTFPVFNGTKLSSNYNNPKSPVYLMVGAGGAGLTHKWATQPAWSAKRIMEYGLGNLLITRSDLTFEFISTDSQQTNILDSITISKS